MAACPHAAFGGDAVSGDPAYGVGYLVGNGVLARCPHRAVWAPKAPEGCAVRR